MKLAVNRGSHKCCGNAFILVRMNALPEKYRFEIPTLLSYRAGLSSIAPMLRSVCVVTVLSFVP
jgi:hypothetical protein